MDVRIILKSEAFSFDFYSLFDDARTFCHTEEEIIKKKNKCMAADAYLSTNIEC